MKKTLFSLLMMAATTCGYAQLEVDANGNTFMGNCLEDSHASLSVNSADEPGVTSSTYNEFKIGTHSYVYSSNSSKLKVVGLYGLANNQWGSTGHISIGVLGKGLGTYYTTNYGVAGCSSGSYGAGIFGSITSTNPYPLTGQYSALFVGPTYTTGSITSRGFYNLSDTQLEENVLSLATQRAPYGTLQSLLNLDVIEYNLNFPTSYETSSKDSVVKAFTNKELQKRHFGLNTELLQKEYPNLVVKGQDGYNAINYVELVPILIRSIQELNQKVEELEGKKEAKTRSADGTDDFGAAATGNVLYQNTPNPFKEQTTIRFQLADDAVNAAICIFDMSGKMLRKLPVSSGMTSVAVNGYELGDGMFLYTLMVNGREIDTKRMILSK